MAKHVRRIRQQRIQRRRSKAAARVASRPSGRFVDIKALANHLGVSPDTVRRLVAAGILPEPIRFGLRCVRWDLPKLQALLDDYLSDRRPMPPLPEVPEPPRSRRGARRTRTKARAATNSPAA